MTKLALSVHRHIGLSTDTKPTDSPVGSTFYEYDTGVLYITYDGTNWAVKDSSSVEKVIETIFTGAANLVVGTSKIAPAAAFRLVAVELHLSATPTTGTQNLVITKDNGSGAAYDTNLLTIDLVANAVTDLVAEFGNECKSTDIITAAWTNTDTKTYGLTFKHELI